MKKKTKKTKRKPNMDNKKKDQKKLGEFQSGDNILKANNELSDSLLKEMEIE